MAVTAKQLIEQVPHIDPRIADEWVNSVRQICADEVEIDGEYVGQRDFEQRVEKRIGWHIRLMNGFGGSDIGVLYLEYTGGFFPFENTAADVVRQKIGMKLPDASIGDVERGKYMEPRARRKFLKQMQAYGLEPYTEAIDALNQYMEDGGDPQHPWMVGSPDALYKDNNGEVWLIDFKVPRTHEACIQAYNFPPLHYQAQLAQYKMLLDRVGVSVDHVVLAPMSIQDMQVYPAEITFEPNLERDILEAGDYYWELVQKHELPEFTPKNKLENVPADKLPENAKKQIYHFTYLKRLESKIKKEADALKNSILSAVQEAGVSYEEFGKKTRIPLLDISMRGQRNFNQETAKKYIASLGGDPDHEDLYTNSVSRIVEVSRGKNSPYAEDIHRIEEIGERVIHEGEMDIADELGMDTLAHADGVTDPRDTAESRAHEPEHNTGSSSTVPDPQP